MLDISLAGLYSGISHAYMQIYFIIFMCDLCEFQENLDDWIRENTIDGFTAKDAIMFGCRVSSVIQSLIDNHFEVIPSFDVVVDEDSDASEKLVIIVGYKNGESIEVHLFLNDYMFIISSRKVPGVEVSKYTVDYGKYAKGFGGMKNRNWELEGSRFLEKTLEVYKSNYVNSKISFKSLRGIRDDLND